MPKKFNPDWDIDYLFNQDIYQYCVIKRPEPLPGEKVLMVREGCTVIEDGRWWYWKLLRPEPYLQWKKNNRWDDSFKTQPEEVVKMRLNKGKVGVVPAPVFTARHDNNWMGADPRVVPNYVSDEMLGDLSLAHLQLCDELQEGKPLLKTA